MENIIVALRLRLFDFGKVPAQTGQKYFSAKEKTKSRPVFSKEALPTRVGSTTSPPARCYLCFMIQCSPLEYYTLVRAAFLAHGKPEVAQGQMAYMRHQFEFFGLKMPQWMALTKNFHAQMGLPKAEDLTLLVRTCFEDEHREMQYFGIETLQKSLKNQDAACIEFLEELICTRSWWDTVDWLNKLVGLHFRRYPELIKPSTERWMASGNIWLQRVCLIFQLPYKDQTDAALLFGYVERLAGSKEFFLQKGAGWALRQYAKTNPAAVIEFVKKTRLAPLTRREALKNRLEKNLD